MAVYQDLLAKNNYIRDICSESAQKMPTILQFIEQFERTNNQTCEIQRHLRRCGLSDTGFPVLKYLYDINDMKKVSEEYVYPADELNIMCNTIGEDINRLWNNYIAATQSHVVEVKHKRRFLGIKGSPYHTYHTEQRFNEANALTALNNKVDILNRSVAVVKPRLHRIGQAYQLCTSEMKKLQDIVLQQRTFVANAQKKILEEKNKEIPKILATFEGILLRLKLFLDLTQKYEQNYKCLSEAETKAVSTGDLNRNDIPQYNLDATVVKKVQHLTTNTQAEIRKKHGENVEKANKLCSALTGSEQFKLLSNQIDQDILKFKGILSDSNNLLFVCNNGIDDMLRIMKSRDLLRENLSAFGEIMSNENTVQNNIVSNPMSHEYSYNVI